MTSASSWDPTDPAELGPDDQGPPPRVAEEVPGPPGGPFAVARRLRQDPLRRLTELRDQYGPVVRLANWPISAFLVCDPDAIADALVAGHRAYAKGAVVRGRGSGTTVSQPLKLLLGEGLLTSEGAAHLRQRRLIQPLFHRARIAEYGEAFVGIADATAARWTDGQPLDLHAELTELTLAIVARTLFDTDLEDAVMGVVRTAVSANLPVARRAARPGLAQAERLPLGPARRRRDSRAALDEAVYRMIADRRAADGDGRDLLSLLLAARDADTGERMDDTQIRDEAMTLLLAGHETTANALAWTFHLLAGEPAVAALLHEELDRVLGGRAPTVADLPALVYTGAVLNEAMRLYPPVWAMARHLETDRTVGGYLLPAGSTLVFSQWVMHHDERYWPRPNHFHPGRWLTDPDDAGPRPDGSGPAARPRFAYFPFGAGPRQCIGNSFALTEGVLVLAALARRWTFAARSAAPVVPEPLVTLRPRGGLPMIAHRRAAAAGSAATGPSGATARCPGAA
jgi:cytochrome P450